MHTRRVFPVRDIACAFGAGVAAFAVFMAFFWGARDVVFIWNDDLPWEAAGLYSYGGKLAQEGRWLVFFWHAAFGIWPRLPTFYLGVACWCLSGGLMALRLIGPGRPVAMLAAAIALTANPFVTWLFLWPHTVLPMMAVMLMSVALLIWQKPGSRGFFLALGAGSLVAMLSYQLFALLLLAYAVLILVAQSERSAAPLFRQLAVSCAVSSAGMVVGLLAMNTANWLVFGTFGLEPVKWRLDDVPEFANRFDLAWQNLRYIAGHLLDTGGIGLRLLLCLSAVTLLVQALRVHRTGGWPYLGLLLLVLAGMVLLPIVVPLASGMPAPNSRGGATLWLAALALPLIAIPATPARSLRLGLGAFLAMVGLWPLQAIGGQFTQWSIQARQNDAVLSQVGADLAGAHGPARRLLLVGPPSVMAGPTSENSRFLSRRFKARLGRAVTDVQACRELEACAISDVAKDMLEAAPTYPLPGYLVPLDGEVMVKLGPMEGASVMAGLQHRP